MRKRTMFAVILSWLAGLAACCSPGRIIPEDSGQKHLEQPIIVLQNADEDFFVFSSSCPYEIGLAESVGWLRLGAHDLAGQRAANLQVRLTARPEGLEEGVYQAAVEIRFEEKSTNESDFILVPVVLLVGEQQADEHLFSSYLQKLLAAEHKRPLPESPEFRVAGGVTPAGHLVLDVLDRAAIEARAAEMHRLASLEQALSADTGYEMVFPFMALEFLSSDLEEDSADIEPNLDAVNMISYERYRISYSGRFTIIEVDGQQLGDPKPWADEKDLSAWPMIIGYSNDYSVSRMYANREEIAEAAVSEALEMGYPGYILDVEGSASAYKRMLYLDFVEHLASELHQAGVKLMVCQARWSTIAPVTDLAGTSVDYVGSMDVMHAGGLWRWEQKIPPTYSEIEPDRLVWIFSWDFFRGSDGAGEQLAQWAWMAENGYNDEVAGAAVFRTPARPPNRYHQIDYYQGFRDYYPTAVPEDDDPGDDDPGDDDPGDDDPGDDDPGDDDPGDDPMTGCFSGTLGHQVEHGACVQVSYAGCGQSRCGWYTCNDGYWQCIERESCTGPLYDNQACSPKNCYSTTWGRWVEHDDCVQVVYSACGEPGCAVLSCDDGFWYCTDKAACTADILEQQSCQGG